MTGTSSGKKQITKKLPPGSIHLQFAGELILPKNPDPSLAGVFRRFQMLFETFANMPLEERLLNYAMINALMMTSHAKKSNEPVRKKELFDLKNSLYLAMANNRTLRRKLAFKYLTSKNFRVVKFCDNCTRKNTEAKREAFQWKFCSKCEVDRSFFNVLSMHHRFTGGYLTLFLSNDLIGKIEGLNLKNRGKLADHDEEARVDRYQYNVRNLDAIHETSVMAMYEKVMQKLKSYSGS